MAREGRALFLAVFAFFAPSAVSAACPESAPSVLALDPGAPVPQIGSHAWALDDPSGRLAIEDVLRADREGRFQRHCTPEIERPAAGDTLWLRLDVRRHAGARPSWAIVFDAVEIDEVRLYRFYPTGDFALKRTGRAVPATARDVASRHPALEINLAKDETARLYMRLSGIGAPFVSAQPLPTNRHFDMDGRDLLILSAVLGFILAMFAYNAVIYVRSGLRQCAFYLLYLGFLVVHIAIYDGLVYRFAAFELSGRLADFLSQGFGAAAGICLLLFGRALLMLKRIAPRIDATALWLVAVIAGSTALEVLELLPYAVASTALLLTSGVFMCAVAVRLARRGNRPAVYFSLSYFALLVGVGLDTVGYFFPVALALEPTIWTALIGVQQNWSFHIGIALETVLISFAITYFIKDMRGEIAAAKAETKALKDGVGGRIGDMAAAMFMPVSSDERFLEAAVAAVQAGMADKDFDVEHLAGALAMTPQTLRRRLRRATGLSPVEFIRRQRLARARHLLEARSHETVAEIAVAVGILNPGRFAKLYREAFGQTPRAVLKENGRN